MSCSFARIPRKRGCGVFLSPIKGRNDVSCQCRAGDSTESAEDDSKQKPSYSVCSNKHTKPTFLR